MTEKINGSENLSLEDLPNEEWRYIQGHKYYLVSNLGRVKSVLPTTGANKRIIRQHQNHKGYLMVSLYSLGHTKTYSVHRLVAKEFIPNPNELPQVNHKDENKQNNCVENLEWCDSKYNNNYGSKRKRLSDNMKNRETPKPRIPVKCYSLSGVLLSTYSSLLEAQKATKINAENISLCIRGKYKQVGGYQWTTIGDDKIVQSIQKRGYKERYIALNEEDGSVLSFTSSRKAAKFFCVDFKTVIRKAKAKKNIGKYKLMFDSDYARRKEDRSYC